MKDFGFFKPFNLIIQPIEFALAAGSLFQNLKKY